MRPENALKIFFLIRLLIGVSFCVLLLLVFFLAYGWVRDPEAEVLFLTVSSEQPPIAGSFINCQMAVRLPWFRRPLPPVYLELHDEDAAVISLLPAGVKKVGPGYWDWQVTAVIQVYRPGKFNGGYMILPLSSRRAGDDYILVRTIPDFNIASALAEGGEARISPAPAWASRPVGTERTSFRLWFLILLAVTVATAGIGFALRKRECEAVPGELFFSPRQEVLRVIEGWRRHREHEDELFLQLTDIIKKYSEQLFGVPAEEKTSEELLRVLRQEQLLPSSRLLFWEQFLIFTDRVKFAGDKVSREEIDSMLDRLCALIVEDGVDEVEISG